VTALLVLGVELARVLLFSVVTAAYVPAVRGGHLGDRARAFAPDLL
jgi:hypothetical protein